MEEIIIFMSYIIKRRVRNSIYVYECTSFRNKQGKPRSKHRYLGKLDADGVLITSKRRLPAQIKEVKTVSRKFIFEPYTPKVSSTDTPIPTKSGSTGKSNTADNTAAIGERITDASTLRLFTRSFSHNAHINGMNTTHARRLIERKPKSLIA